MNVPTEPGYYWAKVDDQWLIVDLIFDDGNDIAFTEPIVEVFGYKDIAPEVVTEWRRIDQPDAEGRRTR